MASKAQPTRLFSWNVNGLRAALKKGAAEFILEKDPDVICLQETRTLPHEVSLTAFSNYKPHWHPAEKLGYSGTLTLTKIDPLKVNRGLNSIGHDTEGRVLTTEFKDFVLVNCYTPNAKRDLSRLPYRSQDWDPAFARYLRKLETKKPVIFCGDLNVAHQEIDLANPKTNRGNAGFTDEERAGFQRLIDLGFVDTFRIFQKEGGHYTWWSQRFGVRQRNIGWRIDYFGISPSLLPRLLSSELLPSIMGSDHCPIMIGLRA